MPDQIHSWESYLGAKTLEQFVTATPNGMLDYSGPTGASRQPVAVARVSGSCWIVDCPSDGGGAEFVNFDDLRFFCCNCRNAAWQGKTLPVQVPDDATRLQIEQVLLQRPEPDTRNWATPETVADLEAENMANGVTS